MDSYLERLHEAIASATKGMTVEDLQRHPPGKWSTAEVLEHLYLSYTGTVKGFGRCWQEGKPLASAQTWKQRAAATLVTGLGYFPNGRKSPQQASPRGMPAERVLAEIGPQIEAMDEVIARCAERHGSGTLILDHPVLGPLTAKQWRKFHWVHGKHHVKQIWKLRG
jgi:Protein of unknown function (DUF1569)